MEAKKISTYYDDFYGMDNDFNYEISKIGEEVKEYLAEFIKNGKAEAPCISMRSKNETKAKDQEKKAPGKAGLEKAKSKKMDSKPPKKANSGSRKSRQKKTKAPGNKHTQESDEELVDAFSKCFHVTKSKPYVKLNETNVEKIPTSHTGAIAKTLSSSTAKPLDQNRDNTQAEKASLCEDLISNKENIPEKVKLPKPLADMAAVLKAKAEASKRNIYAVKLMKGGMRSAKFSICNGRLLLHTLRKKHPPDGVFIVQHNDVMKLVDPSSRLTFLELSEDNLESYGNMYIRLFGDSAGARQFSYLCTGEKGPSLGHTSAVNIFNEKHEKLEYIRFGDYQNRGGTGGVPLVTGLEVGTSEYVRPWVAGTLEGGWLWKQEIGAQFDILLRDNPGRTCQAAFGQVEEGLENLKRLIASNRGIVENVHIRDCGIVLPC